MFVNPLYADIESSISSDKEPVFVMYFNFTTDYSLPGLIHDYGSSGNKICQTDVLLHIFKTTPILSKQIVRNAPERQTTEIMVDFITEFVKNSFVGGSYPRCDYKDFQKGFCKYLEIQRIYDIPMVRMNDAFDLQSLRAWKKAINMNESRKLI